MTNPAPSPWRVMTILGIAIMVTTLNFSVVFVAFDEITEAFNASDSAVSWTLTAFTIALGALIIPAGWLADRYGRKNMLLVGLLIFVVGSGIIAAAPSVPILVAGRVVQAVGLSMESIATLAIVMEAFGPTRRSTAVGGIGGIGGVAAALGPTVGGFLIDAFGWRGTFALNIPIGLLLVALLWRTLHLSGDDGADPSSGGEPPDLVGIAMLVAGSTLFVLAVVQANSWGFGSIRTLGAGLLGFAALVGVVLRSNGRSNAILYLPLYRDHRFRLGSALNLIVGGSFAGLYLAWVNMLIDDWGYSLKEAGLALSLIPLIGGPLSIVAGRLSDRYGHRVVILPGTVLLIVSGIMAITMFDSEANFVGIWLPFCLVYGTGVGLAHAASHASAMVNVPESRLGIGGAMSRIAMDVGSTFSVALIVALGTTNRAAMVLLVVGAVSTIGATQLGQYTPAPS